MDEEFLKGNFKIKKPVKLADENAAPLSSSEKLTKELKEAALAVLGGSMVYVERTPLSWDGQMDKSDKK